MEPEDFERNIADEQARNRAEYAKKMRDDLILQIKAFKRFMLSQVGSAAERTHVEALADLVLKDRFGG
jgi:hypothetical protein